MITTSRSWADSVFILTVAVLLSISAFKPFAQADSESASQSSDGFTAPSKKVTIGLYSDIKSFSTSIAARSNEQQKAILESLPISTFGIDFNYAGLFALGVGASNVNATAEELQARGRTEGSHFRFRFPWRSIYVETAYNRLTGFHSARNENSTDSQTGYEQYPSLKSESFAIRVIYAFKSERYSLASVFDQTEIQNKSGGSFLMGLSTHWTRLTSDISFIPTQIRPTLATESEVTNANFAALSVLVGYGHQFRFFTSGYAFGQALVGGGVQRGTAGTATAQYTARDLASSVRVDFGIGSNGLNYVYGLLASITTNTNLTERTSYEFSDNQVRLFFGKRF